MKRIVIIGSGNVAEGLLLAFARATPAVEWDVVQLYARNVEQGVRLAKAAGCPWTNDPAELAPAELYLIAVSDTAVETLSETLTFPSGAIVAHTAGSLPPTALSIRITHRAVFYPLQTFTAGRTVEMCEVPLCVEAIDPQVEQQLLDAARSISTQVYVLNSAQRARLHLAAVFACNFTNYMYGVSERLLDEANLPAQLLRPLIVETTAKVMSAPSAAAVQTGPAVRGDQNTQAKQIEMLAQQPELQTLYKLISQEIWETSKKI